MSALTNRLERDPVVLEGTPSRLYKRVTSFRKAAPFTHTIQSLVLCDREVPEHQRSAAAKFAAAVTETPCEVVILSSEELDALLRNSNTATFPIG
jgi:hypothetical protein